MKKTIKVTVTDEELDALEDFAFNDLNELENITEDDLANQQELLGNLFGKLVKAFDANKKDRIS